MAKDAIRLNIEGLVADGEPVPQEHEHPQAIVIDVDLERDPWTNLPYECREKP